MAFDIDDFERTSARVQTEDLDLERAFTKQPLDADSLRCLQYMYDIESHTPCFLRDLLVTDAHRDPKVTSFLTLWNYEEHWHGETLGRVLAAHGRPAGKGRVGEVREQMRFRDRLRPMSFILGSLVLPDMVAIHMAWGAINEWSTQTGYGLLSRRAGHPVLTELLSRIMRQEGRHSDFYASECRRRLEASVPAQKVTRFTLTRYWKPVGSTVRPQAETDFLIRHLFSGPEGREAAHRVDRKTDRLPGLAGMRLVGSLLDSYEVMPRPGARVMAAATLRTR